MIFFLALKNTRLYFRKRLPIALFLAATLGLLFIGNTVFSGTDAGMSRTFRTSLTADLSVSSASEDAFTLFGSELPLLGEFFKMPLILEYDQVESRVREVLPEARLLPLVVGAAKVRLGSYRAPSALFAVDLKGYFAFFPSLRILQGAPPEPGQPGLFLNEKQYQAATKKLGRAPALGEPLLLASPQEGSFALKEVPLVGVFQYPVSDPVLENVALVDVGTGRALAGYFITQASNQSDQSVSVDSVNDLFADAEDTAAPDAVGISFAKVAESLEEVSEQPVQDPKTWNFLLIQTNRPDHAALELRAALKSAAAPLQVRDWRETAGGNAKIVGFIQLLFNVGLVFISVVAGLIVMNSMSLAIAERTREIGTMRSLGAGREWLGKLVSLESVILVTGSGILGVFAAVVLILGVGFAGGIAVSNPFLASLLGTARYVPTLSLVLMLEHLLLALGLGVFATILPVFKALRVTPLQAMVRE